MSASRAPSWGHTSWDRAGTHQHRSRGIVVLDPRRYRRHRGHLLMADRLFIGSLWTPLVRVRVRQPRASEGATEI